MEKEREERAQWERISRDLYEPGMSDAYRSHQRALEDILSKVIVILVQNAKAIRVALEHDTEFMASLVRALEREPPGSIIESVLSIPEFAESGPDDSIKRGYVNTHERIRAVLRDFEQENLPHAGSDASPHDLP